MKTIKLIINSCNECPFYWVENYEDEIDAKCYCRSIGELCTWGDLPNDIPKNCPLIDNNEYNLNNSFITYLN